MQSEPERLKGGFSQVTGLLGSFLGDAEDDIVISKTDQLSQSPSRPDPCLIEDVEGDVGEQG